MRINFLGNIYSRMLRIENNAIKVIVFTILLFWLLTTGFLVLAKAYVFIPIMFILFVPLCVIQLYNIQCLFDGHCEIWGWINTAFSVLGLIVFMAVFTTIALMFFGSTALIDRIGNIMSPNNNYPEDNNPPATQFAAEPNTIYS